MNGAAWRASVRDSVVGFSPGGDHCRARTILRWHRQLIARKWTLFKPSARTIWLPRREFAVWRVADELLPLAWRQIDRAAGVIRLEPDTTKNDGGRTFKYGELVEVVAAIEGLWARHEALMERGILTRLVFWRRKGQPIRSFWKRWRTACEAAGCPGRIPHDFRRTAVRNLNRAGVPETGRDEDHRTKDAQCVRSL